MVRSCPSVSRNKFIAFTIISSPAIRRPRMSDASPFEIVAALAVGVAAMVRFRQGLIRKTFAQTEFSGEFAKVILRLEPLPCG